MSTSVIAPSSGRLITVVIPDASTGAAGLVQLCENGASTSGRAVQGNDTRLGNPGSAVLGLATWAGTGAGGNLSVDGTTTPSWGSWSTVGGVRTLTVTSSATIEYDTFTFDFTTYSSIAIVSKGAKFVVRSIVSTGTGTGYCDWNGGDASGLTSGVGAAAVASSAPLAGGQTGSTGRATSGGGTSPGSYNQGLCLGGVGGAGGAAGGSEGGGAGTLARDFTPGTSLYGSIVDFALTGCGSSWTNAVGKNNFQLSGGGGGASGAHQVTGASGGGGGGGGAQIWLVGEIDFGANTLYFRSRGGNGGAGVATSTTGTSGGGGGGGGGAVILIVGSVTGTVTLQANGGDGGNGSTVDADVGYGGAGGNGGLVACVYGSGTAPTGTATGGTGGTASDTTPASNGTNGTVHIVSAVIT